MVDKADPIVLDTESLKIISNVAKKPQDVAPLVNKMIQEGFYSFKIGEGGTIGESVISLNYIEPWSFAKELDAVAEKGEETEPSLVIYRKLRETFPPVTAGIDYYKAFTSGSGFDVKIDDPKDDHQKEMRDIIREFNRNVFMDDTTVGLSSILDVMIDEDLVEGVSAAEIVYEGWKDDEYTFEDWAIPTEPTKDGGPKWTPKEMKTEDWNKLKGISQIKVIPNAYTRLTPYRDPKKWNILYYTVDEDRSKTDKKDVVKLLPWQVLWLATNRRTNKLKGISIIRAIAKSAMLLERILGDLGVSIDRWADKKFFFILGDAKQGRRWTPNEIRNFLNDVKTMSTEHKTGIPVPVGFDIKEIGGEVYDGGQIVDQLISLICAGMKFPRTFFEQGKTQEGDKAWLAWMVIYNRYQTQLQSTVEHQLWARHIWCKEGQTRIIPKQRVPKEAQPVEPVYIPKLEWSAKGKWNQEEKLSMLKDWLNVANPITPILKIAIEADAAVTLGYSDLTFDEMMEQIDTWVQTEKINKELELLKKQMELELLQKFKDSKDYKKLIPSIDFASLPEPEPPKVKEVIAPDISKDELDTGLPPTQEERLQHRIEGGVSVSKKDNPESKKGIAKKPGSTREPNS